MLYYTSLKSLRLSQIRINQIFTLETKLYNNRLLKLLEKNKSGYIVKSCATNQLIRFCSDIEVFITGKNGNSIVSI